ncbi:ABC transporter permease [Cohnella faecalis]|uniref:ABC transporter permease n=1 Tax=Cohnella faecalis TaxID=2315694 RepID=A0A398CGN7_9BACL|nr:ABC transporter permease [Cohnella faecalis]RIE00239.1 ABC transporter permease [Cohnella faecalis]
MNFITLVGFEIRRTLRKPMFLVFQIIFPLLLIFILGSALSNSFQMKDVALKPVQVAWVQEDSGSLAASVDGFLQAPEVKSIVRITRVADREEAVKQVKAGETEFAVIVPAGFSDDVTQGKEANWEWIPGNDRSQNLVAESVFQSFLDHTNGMQAAAIALGPDAATTAAPGAQTAEGGEASYVHVGKLNAKYEYSSKQYYGASMLIMFLLYAGMGASFSLALEKEGHTLSRLNSTPVSEVTLLLGKVFGNFILTLLQSAVIVGFTTAVLGVDWGSSYLPIAIVCVSLSVLSISLAVIGTALIKNTKSLQMVFQIPIMVMTFLSGGFTPLPEEGAFGHLREFTVNHWAFQSLLNNMLGSDSSIVWHQTGVLAAIAATILALSVLAYRKVGYRE